MTKKPSRRFTPPQPQDSPAVTDATVATEPQLTVNGKAIPEEFAHLINYAMTDQGQAEARALDAERGMKPSGVKVTGDAWDKSLDRRANAEPWDSFDAMREAVERVQEPGFSYRFLSPRVCDKRGTRAWEKVLDQNGREVKVGNLFLGRMPVERKEQRNKHYRDIGEEALRDAAQHYEETQAKLVRDANVGGLAPLRVGDRVQDYETPDLNVPDWCLAPARQAGGRLRPGEFRGGNSKQRRRVGQRLT
jgi:hypothetical protein